MGHGMERNWDASKIATFLFIKKYDIISIFAQCFSNLNVTYSTVPSPYGLKGLSLPARQNARHKF